MKHTEYECDRCGSKSGITMKRFKSEFGRPENQTHPLTDLETGDLCRVCEKEWNEKFFNTMVAWIKGGKA